MRTGDFWWGTAASSTQAEGAAPASDWLQWEEAGRVPRSGDGNGFASRYEEDFAMLAGLGLRHHRLSVEWARVEPEPGRRDPQAVAHYRDVLAAARDKGIDIWVCLHHFTLPVWFVDAGGFASAEGREYWKRHVHWMAETFGDHVHGWKPVNEPVAFAGAGRLLGMHPPGERDVGSFLEQLEATYIAALEAARILHGSGRPVATIEAVSPVFAASGSEADESAARLVDDVYWGVWTRMLGEGVLHVPLRDPLEVPDAPDVFDLAGFSYYSATSISADLSMGPYPAGAEVGPMGYVPWSEGIGIVLDRLADTLPGRDILICEHGVGTTDDDLRCTILSDSLDLVGAAVRDGVPVRGFFHWTAVDNYEWSFGYDVPFGIIDAERVPRASARLLSDRVAAGLHPPAAR